ncbi:methyltransferase domain-containing protein [Nonomuraea wenchangensis]
MLATSINLNKRLGSAQARSRFVSWLHAHKIRILLAQEPFKPPGRDFPELPGFVPAGGDGHLAAWIHEDHPPPPASTPQPWLQRIELEWLAVYQVHLDPYTAATRIKQLGTLTSMAEAEAGRPLMICGDFNLAPNPEDGLFGEQTSGYSTKGERTAFRHLLTSACLLDPTETATSAFTIDRISYGQRSRFRCDLALVSDHLAPTVTVTSDARTRSGVEAFTDHSGLLIDLPVTLPVVNLDNTLFSLSEFSTESATPIAPQDHVASYKTAKNRLGPSPAARAVAEQLTGPLGVSSILDHGCGRGADVGYYRSYGLEADGYDPHEPFGWPRPARRGYDLVTSMFVLNVLPDPWQRIRALKDAASFIRPGGHVVVVTRSPEEIDKAAAEGGWAQHHDGFWSSTSRRTFQRGIAPGEIIALGHQANLISAAKVPVLSLPTVSHVVLTKTH